MRAWWLLLVVVAGGAGCPNSLIGGPCNTIGEETCEGEVPLRCDSRRWQKLGDCSAACVQGPLQVHDETDVATDTTWTCIDGKHVVDATITVAEGQTLTIEEGAIVEIAQGARLDAAPGARIVAEGSNLVPITFTSKDHVLGGYGGLNLGGVNVFANADGEPTRLVNIIIEQAIHGLGIFGLADGVDPPVVQDSTFRDNLNYGILIRGCQGAPEIPDFVAAGNQFFTNHETDETDDDVSVCDP
jgi:hypothetical protein